MPMDENEIVQLIKKKLPDADVSIRDLAGDGDHYAATVVSEAFRGKTRVQQHQLVTRHQARIQTQRTADTHQRDADSRRRCPGAAGR